MVYLTVVLRVKDSADIPEIRRLLSEQGRLSRAEPGCLRFEVYQSNGEPGAFFLVEQWETPDALETHRSARACTEIYKPLVLPKVDRTAHECTVVE